MLIYHRDIFYISSKAQSWMLRYVSYCTSTLTGYAVWEGGPVDP